jgi:hypothetical protein
MLAMVRVSVHLDGSLQHVCEAAARGCLVCWLRQHLQRRLWFFMVVRTCASVRACA